MQWKGVMPAMTTPFDESLQIDWPFVDRHARWLEQNGCTGIVCLGSLGEAATLDFDEKINIVRKVVAAVSPSRPRGWSRVGVVDSGGSAPCQGACRRRCAGTDDSAAICLPGRLA